MANESPTRNPIAFSIAALGALTLIIAVFLPYAETSAFSLGGIKQNTLIQMGDGWILLGLAVGILGAAYKSYSGTKPLALVVMLLGVIAIGVAIYDGTNKDSMTL